MQNINNNFGLRNFFNRVSVASTVVNRNSDMKDAVEDSRRLTAQRPPMTAKDQREVKARTSADHGRRILDRFDSKNSFRARQNGTRAEAGFNVNIMPRIFKRAFAQIKHDLGDLATLEHFSAWPNITIKQIFDYFSKKEKTLLEKALIDQMYSSQEMTGNERFSFDTFIFTFISFEPNDDLAFHVGMSGTLLRAASHGQRQKVMRFALEHPDSWFAYGLGLSGDVTMADLRAVIEDLEIEKPSDRSMLYQALSRRGALDSARLFRIDPSIKPAEAA